MSRYLLLLAFLGFANLSMGQRANRNSMENSRRTPRAVQPVCEREFQQVLGEMRRNVGQSAKLCVALAATEDHFFNSSQVFAVLKKLSWDSDKVKFAKAAYVKMVDTENYDRLGAAFGLKSYLNVFYKWVVDYDEKTAALRFLMRKRNKLSPLSAHEFAEVKKQMNKQAGQSNKTLVALDALRLNYLTSVQVMELMHKLSWDSDRMKVAKAAYGKTLDIENFQDVGQAFYYRSYERLLQKYVRNYDSFALSRGPHPRGGA